MGKTFRVIEEINISLRECQEKRPFPESDAMKLVSRSFSALGLKAFSYYVQFHLQSLLAKYLQVVHIKYTLCSRYNNF